MAFGSPIAGVCPSSLACSPPSNQAPRVKGRNRLPTSNVATLFGWIGAPPHIRLTRSTPSSGERPVAAIRNSSPRQPSMRCRRNRIRPSTTNSLLAAPRISVSTMPVPITPSVCHWPAPNPLGTAHPSGTVARVIRATGAPSGPGASRPRERRDDSSLPASVTMAIGLWRDR